MSNNCWALHLDKCSNYDYWYFYHQSITFFNSAIRFSIWQSCLRRSAWISLLYHLTCYENSLFWNCFNLRLRFWLDLLRFIELASDQVSYYFWYHYSSLSHNHINMFSILIHSIVLRYDLIIYYHQVFINNYLSDCSTEQSYQQPSPTFLNLTFNHAKLPYHSFLSIVYFNLLLLLYSQNLFHLCYYQFV